MSRVLVTRAHLTAAVTLSLAAAAVQDAEPIHSVTVKRPYYEPDEIMPAIGRQRNQTAPRSPRQSFKKSSKR